MRARDAVVGLVAAVLCAVAVGCGGSGGNGGSTGTSSQPSTTGGGAAGAQWTNGEFEIVPTGPNEDGWVYGY